ncbi:hypothetical protein PsYK624_170100 [Phanerochaete sordida]|uniref:Uncharacterized protein n=1 Tax=Phanerochaete sordida TaxID=48140 RepID=A0A9P3GTD5_9APHY|nr:hypothetical protein PsYK624_170100 [Phanerochaete sordida]
MLSPVHPNRGSHHQQRCFSLGRAGRLSSAHTVRAEVVVVAQREWLLGVVTELREAMVAFSDAADLDGHRSLVGNSGRRHAQSTRERMISASSWDRGLGGARPNEKGCSSAFISSSSIRTLHAPPPIRQRRT